MRTSGSRHFVKRQARAAFTLLELLLVLAILVIASAMVVPFIQGMLDDQKLTDVADMFRGKAAVAKTHAVNDGVAYRFGVKITDDELHWRVAPDSDDFWSNQGSPSQDAFIDEGSIKGIRFKVKGNGLSGGGGNNSSDFTRLLSFYPDGTAQSYGDDGLPTDTARMINLQNPGDDYGLVIQIRGLTGAIRSEWKRID